MPNLGVFDDVRLSRSKGFHSSPRVPPPAGRHELRLTVKMVVVKLMHIKWTLGKGAALRQLSLKIRDPLQFGKRALGKLKRHSPYLPGRHAQ